jgi:hypothetical protein
MGSVLNDERVKEAPMENFVWLIPVLGCGLMMVVMMLMMGKGMSMMGGEKHDDEKEEAAERPVAELRAERDRLEAEISRREDVGRPPGEGGTSAGVAPDRGSPA